MPDSIDDQLITGTIADLIRQMVSDEKDEEYVKEYFKIDFLTAAIDALSLARRRAGLTQVQVAERLKTKQSAIARLESDTTGAISLRRYVEFALACDMVPLEIKMVPVRLLREYTQAHPEEPKTESFYNTWLQTKRQTVTTAHSLVTTGGTTVMHLNSNIINPYENVIVSDMDRGSSKVCRSQTALNKDTSYTGTMITQGRETKLSDNSTKQGLAA